MTFLPWRSGSLALAALTVVSLLLGGPARAATDAPNASADVQGDALARTLVARTTADGAMRHLAAFQHIADEAGGNRAAGTPGHDRSARYAGALLTAAGYRVTYQRFTFPYREPVTERLTVLGDQPRDIPVNALTYTANTPEGGLTAGLAPAGTGCAADDFDPAAHTGRIALIERGTCTFAAKQANAAAAGAVGALVFNNAPGELSGTLGGPDPDAIPTGGITRDAGRELAAELAAGRPVTVRLELAELAEERTTTNVLAETRGGDPSRVVLAGAHLDSVPEGPGINDNGSGAAGVLETALRLAEADPAGRHPHKVRFALWSAEEFGLLGARHHVNGLSPAAREDIALYLNFDMIGSPNHGLFVHDGDPAIAADLTAFLTERGHTPRGTPFDGRSDYAPFVEAGIPSGGLFTGAEGIKSPEEAERWGGTAGVAYDPCYHAACDDLGNIGRTALGLGVKAIAHAVGRYAWGVPDSSP
ncbi:M28 family peptidase [Streptomyces litchfieldiae]|uniref:M28 family peptidase n=1 Tax=Streptomyces litchfieldiae TaxID=3075543 RepID=A0ABU2MK88_9ACTN|nr:M28 family peptidase [Streptomyces sp. DSM 44938]MDT0342004.1 M28 family peptidase [Streptomyces sp. DSM 44938]